MRSRQLAELLTEKGITHDVVFEDGVHNYQQWQRNLAALLPKLFR